MSSKIFVLTCLMLTYAIFEIKCENQDYDAKDLGKMGFLRQKYRRIKLEGGINELTEEPSRWCGFETITRKYWLDLKKKNVQVDECCNNYDSCPLVYENGVKKQDIKHCNCDRQFYHCLKSAGYNSTVEKLQSDRVGAIVYDALRPICFISKPNYECTTTGYIFNRKTSCKIVGNERNIVFVRNPQYLNYNTLTGNEWNEVVQIDQT